MADYVGVRHLLTKLLDFDTLLSATDSEFRVKGVVWKEGFGPWAKGERCYSIEIQYWSCTIIEYDEDDNRLATQRVTLIPDSKVSRGNRQ